MKAFKGILGGFNRTASRLERLSARNTRKALAKLFEMDRLEAEVKVLRDEAAAADKAAANIRALVGEHE